MIKPRKVPLKTPQKDGKSSPVILAALVQVLVIILFFLGKGYLLTVTDDPVSAYGGTGLTLLAIDILALRKILDKKEDVWEALNISKRSIVSDISIPAVKEKVIGAPKEKTSIKEDISDLNAVSAVISREIEYSDVRNEAFNIQSAGMDETAVLYEKEPDIPYLSYKHDGIVERINISKNSFILGRLQGQVDYVCTNNAVGKVHAEILTREHLYYLKDLNSRNGSFLNGMQLIPNKENEIRSGDRISIANSDFTFHAPAGANV